MAGDYSCSHPTCHRTPGDGTIHRISPKGERFVGRCEEHLGRPVDPEVVAVTDLIELHNQEVRHGR